MKKIRLTGFFILLCSLYIHAQDNPTSLRSVSGEMTCQKDSKKTMRYRIMGGPTLSYMLNSDEGFGKGMVLGSMAGLEFNYRIGKRTYAIMGSTLNSNSYEGWLNARDGSFVSHKNLSIEVPLGIGYHFGKNMPKGFFASISFMNSFTMASKAIYQTSIFQGLIINKSIDNPDDLYNIGGRLEFGFKGLMHDKYYTSFSGIIKPMLMNLSSNDQSTTVLTLGIAGSIYF